ncbi:MAG: DUF3592 domain-containing protein [Cyanobium sp.]
MNASSSLAERIKTLPQPQQISSRRSWFGALIRLTVGGPFMLLMGLGLVVIPVVELVNTVELRQQGRLAEAAVVDKKFVVGQPDSYTVFYAFSAFRQGRLQRFKSQKDVSAELYQSLTKGGKVRVLYAASNPDNSTIQEPFGFDTFIGAILYSILCITFPRMGFLTLSHGALEIKELYLLKRDGRFTQAIIFDRWQYREDTGDGYVERYVVAYAFEGGLPRQIITAAIDNVRIHNQCKIGDSLRVHYVHAQPTICEVVTA